MSFKILVINPGSTSTKIGVYEDETLLFDKTLRHSAEDIAQFNSIPAQKDWRCQLVLKALREENFDINTLSAVSGRGGLLRPIRGGTYAVNDNLVNDCTIGVQGQHASNLGGIIAREIGDSLGIPSYIVDPVVVDELADVARYAGHPLFQRVSIFHALNQKAVAKRYAKEVGAMAVVMKGKVDQIILTGGIAYGKETVNAISAMVDWIAPITVYPGEDELLALAQGALRVLRGEEKAQEYRRPRPTEA